MKLMLLCQFLAQACEFETMQSSDSLKTSGSIVHWIFFTKKILLI
jgi:hypothetical protein